MANKDKAARSPKRNLPVARPSNRTPIPSRDLGVTLMISEKARAELDRIEEETIKAAEEAQKFSWR